MKSIKSKVLVSLLAFALAVTSVGVPSVSAEAATNKKAVKSVTLKVKNKKVNKKTTTLQVGKTLTVKTTVNPSSAKKSISYKTSNKKIATVSKKGKVKGIKAGTAKITVTVTGKNKEKKSAWFKVKVTKKSTAKATPTESAKKVEVKTVGVTINPATIKVGEKAQLTVKVEPSNAQNNGFTYASSNPSVATVDKKGVVSGVAGGTTTITATATNGVSGSVSITVEETEVTSVVLDKPTLTLAKGAKGKLTAAVLPTTAKNKKVSWASSNPTVASVTNDGEISALTPGTANITVTTDEGKRTATCVVTVTNTTNENVDGLSAEVTNPMNEEHPGVVLTGTSAYIQVRLANDGKPVGGSSVELTYEAKYGNAPDYFELKESSVKETNSDGIVTYVFGLKDEYSKLTATDDIYQSYKVTITAVGSNQKIDIPVSFACIEFNDIYVRNNLDPTITDIVPGTNVISDGVATTKDGLYVTKSTNGYKNWEYVTSQQESLTDTAEHEVHIAAIPYLILPAIEGETTTEFYEKIQHSDSSEYSVYNDDTNTTTTTVVTDVPAGLNYITLHFSKIELSEYTRMKILLVDADNGKVYDRIYKDVTNNILNAGVQIEIQENEEIDVVISLESAGQVNDDKNEGYVLEKVTGLWKSSGLERRTEEELVSSVKWSVVNAVYSDPQEMSFTTAQQYINVDANTSKKEILKEENTYSYRVPSFPYSGDAIITVKDENGKEIAYYLYPAENSWEWATDAYGNKFQKWLNVNVLAAPKSEGYAIYATADEVTAKVGELKQEGNVAIVNSNIPGRTHLKAVLSIPELGQIDATNGAVGYTSVQWAPRPNEEEAVEQKDFYALIGQTIEVEAQLYSANGSKYTGSEVPIEFFYEYADETKVPASGKSINNEGIVTVVNNPTKTDTDGHAVLQVKASQAAGGHLIGVWAKSKTSDGETYTVKLSVKGTETEVANLYWIDAGLAFKDRIQYDQVSDTTDGTTTIALSDTVEVKGLLPRTVGSHWIFGYQLIGALDRDDYVVGEISGINIDVQKENVGSDLEPYTVDGIAQNGVVRAYSEQTGSTTIIGTVNDDQINKEKEVVFSIYDKVTLEKIGDFINVGVGTSTINATLRLPFAWTNLGLVRKIIAPLGTQLNQETATNAYIQVTDQYGNVYKDKEVEYWTISTTGVDSHVIGSEEAREKAKTDSNGLVKISLPAPKATGATTIYAVVNGEKVIETINYQNQTDKTQKDFALVNALYKPASADENLTNDQIILTFSNRIDEKTLDVKMFDVLKADDEAISYTIKSAELDPSKKVVILTMANTTLQSVQDKIKVRVSEYTPEVGTEAGVEKELVDVYGATVEPNYNEVVTHPNAAYTINASYDNGVITAVVKKGNTVITTLDENIYAVSEMASVLNNATGVIASSTQKIVVTPASQTTKVTLYYLGASTTIDIASEVDTVEVNASAEEETVEEVVNNATTEEVVEEAVETTEATAE